ncbi:GerA spore germination protein [Bacillus sp. OV322]|uniref:spore germination protein n=1 Tax=Bacillus sp. OV322 TaxID=1882764 RepID=UPI0008E50596|nr:spore germination protein [Bacillus sp. OV322]SFC09572.1 GerA spore germination protein [Bacillus sp. OV322]
MFSKKKSAAANQKKNEEKNWNTQDVTLELLKNVIAKMDDAKIVQRKTNNGASFSLVYIQTLIDKERLNEAVIQPLLLTRDQPFIQGISTCSVLRFYSIEEAKEQMMFGAVLIHDQENNEWWAVKLENSLSRAIENSEVETIMYGPKDSFTERIEQNIFMIRRRLPVTELKAEKFQAGSNTKTQVQMLYIEGIANPDIVEIARKSISKVNFDLILEASNLSAFMDDHTHSLFPQFMQTDRPDSCAYSLGLGKIIILINDTPFALIAPITFFHLFQSPEDYVHRWVIASFLRILRYFSFFIAITLIPLYVALTSHHYQMIPLQILYVLTESRTKLPFTPFWESVIMLVIIEIIKEASLRMPTKTSQTIGVIGGIVIGQAAVEAGFASKVLIVLVGISAIASFLVPNYLVTKATTVLQFLILILASILGILGIAFGLILLLAHLNGLSSLKQPFFAPVAPLYWRDWKDLFVRAPLPWAKLRPEYLKTVKKWRVSKGEGSE